MKLKFIPPNHFNDFRGQLWTSWDHKIIKLNFNHDKFSLSKKMY